MLHTVGLPARADGARALERSRRARRSFRRLAAQLGAGHRVRVPRHVGPLGSRRAHRAPDRAGLPHLHPRAHRTTARACPACASDSRSTSKTTSHRSAPSASPPRPDELEAVFGIRELPLTEVTDHALLEFNSPDARRAGVPGGGGVTRAAELALFYQALLTNPGDLWDAGCARRRHRQRAQPLPRPVGARDRQPHARARRGGRRRQRAHAHELRPHRLAAGVRPCGRRGPDRVGRPRDRPLVLLFHQRSRRPRPEAGAPRAARLSSRAAVLSA